MLTYGETGVFSHQIEFKPLKERFQVEISANMSKNKKVSKNLENSSSLNMLFINTPFEDNYL